jgi:hypothetical protein
MDAFTPRDRQKKAPDGQAHFYHKRKLSFMILEA